MPRYDNIPEIAPNLDGSGLRVGVVMCRFNLDVCEGLLSACTAELLRLGVAADAITIATVPGALEAPLTLQVMAKSGRFDALVALGAVIRGETYHIELAKGYGGTDGHKFVNGVLDKLAARLRPDEVEANARERRAARGGDKPA